MKVYAWLIDLIHRRKNCPTGMISGWVQKVTQHNGIIQYMYEWFVQGSIPRRRKTRCTSDRISNGSESASRIAASGRAPYGAAAFLFWTLARREEAISYCFQKGRKVGHFLKKSRSFFYNPQQKKGLARQRWRTGEIVSERVLCHVHVRRRCGGPIVLLPRGQKRLDPFQTVRHSGWNKVLCDLLDTQQRQSLNLEEKNREFFRKESPHSHKKISLPYQTEPFSS